MARRASVDLAAYDDRYAGAAHYVLGDLCRLRGQLGAAEAEFATAADLGRTPQPGSALLAAQRGHHADALATLGEVLECHPDLGAAVVDDVRAALALAEVAADAGEAEVVVRACERVVALAGDDATVLVVAYRELAGGRAAVASSDPETGGDHLGRAVAGFDALAMPYDAARARVELASAMRATGDIERAVAVEEAATAALDALGAATADATSITDHSGLAQLSMREREVLALVASGQTNQDVAASLHLSPHTVARHLANIFTKLGVRSRTAAAASAVAAGLVHPRDGQS